MSRPLTRAQALQNQAFLRALRRTGNARLAAREVGMHRATLTRRRAAHPAFAAQWDAALAIAHANAHESAARASGVAAEPRLVRLRSGRLQLRRPVVRGITRADEQAFLTALSATANVRLAARAAGFSHASFYARRRDPAFAREMRLALETGYDQLEMALLAANAPDSCEHDAWRHNAPPPVPPMTASQALQLLHLHHKTARLWAEHPYMRKLRHETKEQWSARLALLWTAKKEREAEARQLQRAGMADATAPDRARAARHEPPPPVLPALDQVKGWSKASGNPPHHDGVALFGGWRVGDL